MDPSSNFDATARFRRYLTALRLHTRKIQETHSVLPLTRGEKNVVQSALWNTMGLWQGAVAGIVTLAILRQGPKYMVRPWSSNRAMKLPKKKQSVPSQVHRVQNSPFEAPPSSFSTGKEANNPPSFLKSPSFLLTAGWWLIDITLSVAMAGAVAFQYMPPSLFLEHVGREIPLVRPHSNVADLYCPTVLQVAREIEQQEEEEMKNTPLSKPYTTDSQFSTSDAITNYTKSQQRKEDEGRLQAMLAFLKSCRERNRRDGVWEEEDQQLLQDSTKTVW